MTPSPLTVYLAAVEARADAATPGPLHAWDRGIGWEVHVGRLCGPRSGPDCRVLNSEDKDTFCEADAMFHAHAPDDLRTLLAIARRCVEALTAARAGLIATSLGGVSDEDGRETALQSWCDDGWTCEHDECVKGRAGIEAIDQTLADLARMGEGGGG